MFEQMSSPQTQEKLPQYLDLVELALLKLIWSRSPSFFKAIDDVKGLQRKVSETISHTSTLRKELRKFDQQVVLTSLKIPRLQQRQENQKKVAETLSSIQAIVQVHSK